jgi:signal transduction histidine kinase
MELTRRTSLVYVLLALAWTMILGWQAVEHLNVRQTARVALRERAKDISNTLGIVLRSQRRFGGFISKERLESALADLVKPDELNGLAILNADGNIVAAAGILPDTPTPSVTGLAERWTDATVTIMNLVDLGTNITHDIEGVLVPSIVLPRKDYYRPSDTNQLTSPPFTIHRPPSSVSTNFAASLTITGTGPVATSRHPWFFRPHWMSDNDYKAALQKQGVRSFLLVMSTQPFRDTATRDLWIRLIIALFATIAAAGGALAWRNLTQSANLQLRLVRASELNTHLREMNLAAAGLAHETRNPLNIIRGLAQMISKQPNAPGDIPAQSRSILAEVDKVTAQLNEFINYSRPREVRRAPVPLIATINEVHSALLYDIEEKRISYIHEGEAPLVEADEQLLRQALFNLAINAIQAMEPGGELRIVTGKANAGEAFLEIRDTGPGVPPERRQEIFKPYVTTHQRGTGLGLAVVQQITLLHGWVIECLPNEPKGAIFRLTHLKLAGKT